MAWQAGRCCPHHPWPLPGASTTRAAAAGGSLHAHMRHLHEAAAPAQLCTQTTNPVSDESHE